MADVAVKETVDAGVKLGQEAALKLASGASTIVIARGKHVVTFSMKKDRPDDDTLLSHMLGPTGNLRAPTIRRGKTLVVGFSEAAYREHLASG